MPGFTRKRIRLKNYDYSSNGAYFITVCTNEKRCTLGCIHAESNATELNACGKTVAETIERLPKVFAGVDIPVFVIMPNHVHMIVELKHQTKTVSQIINYFKGCVTRRTYKEIWQKSFYEHVIRNEKDYNEIAEYILLNPIKWSQDKYYKNTQNSQ